MFPPLILKSPSIHKTHCRTNVRYHAVDLREGTTLGLGMPRGYGLNLSGYATSIIALYKEWSVLSIDEQKDPDNTLGLFAMTNYLGGEISQLSPQISLSEQFGLASNTVFDVQSPAIRLFRHLVTTNPKITKQYEAFIKHNYYSSETVSSFQKGLVLFLKHIEQTLIQSNVPEFL